MAKRETTNTFEPKTKRKLRRGAKKHSSKIGSKCYKKPYAGQGRA